MKDEEMIKNEKKGVNTKLIVIIVAGVILVAAAVVLVIKLGVFNFVKKDNKAELETKMTELAKDFYEVKYYPGLTNSKTGKTMTDEEKVEFAKRFKDTGITIDLAGLARLQSDKDKVLKEFVNSKTKKECNTEETKAIIYPESPFGVSDYKIEIQLSCGFDKK